MANVQVSEVEEHFTYCGICEQLCGLRVTTDGDAVVKIKPDRDNPHNWADFCIKGATADEYRTHPSRLRSPMKRVGDSYVEVSHEEAVDGIAKAFQTIMERDGPNAIGAYVGNPNAFNFANSVFHGAFMNAIGSHNRYWVGSVDQNPYHYVGEAMYGSAYTTLIPDIDDCSHLLLVGANPAVSGMGWVGSVPNGWKRCLAAVKNGAQLSIIDPRRTESASRATTHLAPSPETDWALLLAMVHTIFAKGLEDKQACALASNGDKVREIAMAQDPQMLARRCDVPLEQITKLAIDFATAETAACVARTGSAVGRNGTLTEWLSHILNLITGRIDVPGGRVLCDGVTDFMKLGSEVFAPAREPSRLRQWDPVGGAHALAELPDEITTPGAGQIRGLIINAGNPVISGPNGSKLDEALAQLECLVAIDLFQRESHRHAHWLIPGLHFLENEEIHVFFSSFHDEPFVQQSKKVVDHPQTLRPEWEFYRDLSAAMGLSLFDGMFPPDPRAVEDGLLAMGGRTDRAAIEAAPHGLKLGPKTFGRLANSLRTDHGKIEAAPDAIMDMLMQRLQEPVHQQANSAFPYQIISRRRLQTMNSWLTESSASRLPEETGAQITICPQDAERDGFSQDDRVEVTSATASVQVDVAVSDQLRPGVAIMEYGWGSRTFDPQGENEPDVRGVNRNELVSGEDLDPLARVPRLNGTRVRINPI